MVHVTFSVLIDFPGIIQLKNSEKEAFMARALQLAKKAVGKTSPNPMVGAVIVKNGKVIGEGYHKQAGKAHAEVEAIKKAGEKTRGADMFVNLEPCCHYGKTPPCVDAILSAGLKKVYIGMTDPNKLVNKRGIGILRKQGVKVEVGILKEECECLNESFAKFIRTGKPFVIMKSGISLDGKIATSSGESQWITCEKSRKLVHKMRGEVDAILVGSGTVLKDDPCLTVRLNNRRLNNPVRVILDGRNRVKIAAKVFENADADRVIYVTSSGVSKEKEKRLCDMGVDVLKLPKRDKCFKLKTLLEELGRRNIVNILLEGGSLLNASALKEKIVDKAILFVAPIIIGGENAPGFIGGKGVKKLKDAFRLQRVEAKKIGEDFMIEGYF
jgi:diaminohydroxyphosphoribosylaminopyrimidine deaminase / 5-amino-6-(5-phosphoribosylamino)uracil reductase